MTYAYQLMSEIVSRLDLCLKKFGFIVDGIRGEIIYDDQVYEIIIRPVAKSASDAELAG